MQRPFPRSVSFAQAPVLEWRVSALILMAALLLSASQGCGIISDAPSRATSAKEVSPAPPTGNPSIHHPPAHAFPREIPPITTIPSAPETHEAPPLAPIPAPSQPTLVETGLGSWYGRRFHGKLTANGEVFDPEKFTAAHRTLPWGSRVTVTNLTNGKSVEVRINDRGPFGKGRIIDVSRAAARVLGMVGSGITTVRVEWFSDSEK